MIARLTRWMIALQLFCIAGLAAMFFAFAEMSLLVSILTSSLLVMLPRVVIVANNFFLSGAVRQDCRDGARPSWLSVARMIVQEFFCSSRCWYWALPFGAFGNRMLAQDTGLPVLLIHGYGANSGFWQSCSKLLAQEGISHQAIDLEPLFAGIDDYAVKIAQAIDTLCRASGKPQVILLAHSMGGLAARAYVRRYGSARIAQVITLGAPHFGSTLASYAMGLNARQMLPVEGQKSWLADLAQSESAEIRKMFVSIYSHHDNIVAPQSSGFLPDAHNIGFDLVGHVALGFDEQVLQVVMQKVTAVRQSR